VALHSKHPGTPTLNIFDRNFNKKTTASPHIPAAELQNASYQAGNGVSRGTPTAQAIVAERQKSLEEKCRRYRHSRGAGSGAG
jgi:hypothetical protein